MFIIWLNGFSNTIIFVYPLTILITCTFFICSGVLVHWCIAAFTQHWDVNKDFHHYNSWSSQNKPNHYWESYHNVYTTVIGSGTRFCVSIVHSHTLPFFDYFGRLGPFFFSMCFSEFQRASKPCLSIPLLCCFHSGIGVMSKRFQTQSLSKELCWQGLLFICHGGCNKL